MEGDRLLLHLRVRCGRSLRCQHVVALLGVESMTGGWCSHHWLLKHDGLALVLVHHGLCGSRGVLRVDRMLLRCQLSGRRHVLAKVLLLRVVQLLPLVLSGSKHLLLGLYCLIYSFLIVVFDFFVLVELFSEHLLPLDLIWLGSLDGLVGCHHLRLLELAFFLVVLQPLSCLFPVLLLARPTDLIFTVFAYHLLGARGLSCFKLEVRPPNHLPNLH